MVQLIPIQRYQNLPVHDVARLVDRDAHELAVRRTPRDEPYDMNPVRLRNNLLEPAELALTLRDGHSGVQGAGC